MSFIDDLRKWSRRKKLLSVVVISCIGIIIIAMVIGSFFPYKNTSTITGEIGSNSTEVTKVWDEGTYKIGSDLPPGEYRFIQTSNFGGSVIRYSDSSMELDSIISNDSTSYKGSIVYVLVNEGEYLKIEGGRIFLFYVQ